MTKTLILIRHAHALSRYESAVPTDSARMLSAQGRQKALQSAQDLLARQEKPQIILTSPLLRALQTAQIASEVLNAPVKQQPILDGFHPDAQVRDFLLGELTRYDCILAVGHNPCITYVTALLCGQVYPFAPASFALLRAEHAQSPLQLIYFGE